MASLNEFVTGGDRHVPIRREEPIIIKISQTASGRIPTQRPVNLIFQNMRTGEIDTHPIARAGASENHDTLGALSVHA